MKLLKLNLAGAGLILTCHNPELAYFLEEELSSFRDDRINGQSSRIAVDLVETQNPLFERIELGENKFLLPGKTELLIEYREREDGPVLTMHARLDTGADNSARRFLCSFILNHCLNLFLQIQNRRESRHFLMMHACGVVVDGGAFLFTGASGAGKSTIARELMNMETAMVLGDDMIILVSDQQGWKAFGSPLGGDIPRAELKNTGAPLKAIFVIRQAAKVECRPLERAQIIPSLITAVVPVLPLKFTANQKMAEYDRQSLDLLIGEAAMLASAVPCFSLVLTLRDSPWKEIFMTHKGGIANG